MQVFRKRNGMVLLLEAALVCLMMTILDAGIIELQTAAFTGLKTAGIGYEAQFIAASKAGEIAGVAYSELKSETIVPVGKSDYKLVVTVGTEESKPKPHKLVTISVYSMKDIPGDIPRYSMSTVRNGL